MLISSRVSVAGSASLAYYSNQIAHKQSRAMSNFVLSHLGTTYRVDWPAKRLLVEGPSGSCSMCFCAAAALLAASRPFEAIQVDIQVFL